MFLIPNYPIRFGPKFICTIHNSHQLSCSPHMFSWKTNLKIVQLCREKTIANNEKPRLFVNNYLERSYVIRSLWKHMVIIEVTKTFIFFLKISQNSNSPNLMKHLDYSQIQQNLALQSEIDFENSKTLIYLCYVYLRL